MSAAISWPLRAVLAIIAGLVVAATAQADSDEAWLARANLPGNVQPLLALIVDHSAAATETMAVAAPYDSSIDYGPRVPAEFRCDPARIYWRRGAGPAPNCADQAGIEPAPTDPARGLHCEAARPALARQGFYFVVPAS